MFNTLTLTAVPVFFCLTTVLFSSETLITNDTQNTEEMHADTCPTVFYQLQLSLDASACHVFAGTLPASITYHSNQSPKAVDLFLRQQIDTPFTQTFDHNRILLHLEGNRKIIVISPDGPGSQVDILINPR
ncbi:hypothetical protein [Paraglaciecola sp. 20A4]|uniref:hypothetical protein n=1 Tax=Paraglaciecola sp. 20A4 TaxID=2687288 RepID=UPI001407AA92|nr:hypothetical protein [Paraglaciecola sp. 20A4]